MLKMIFRIFYVIVTFIEGILALRFVFKLLSLPASVPAVGIVYSLTSKLVYYFSGTGISDFTIMGFFVETSTFIALVASAILAGVLNQLISKV